MPQDVADIVPRVRRALEGLKALESNDPSRLSDAQVEAAAADAIANLILYTTGTWPHTLEREVSTDDPPVESYTVDPALTIPEEGLVAAQAALDVAIQTAQSVKATERIKNEGREWETTTSVNLMRDVLKALTDARDKALGSASISSPPLARAFSYMAYRDPLTSALVEPEAALLGRGGYELTP